MHKYSNSVYGEDVKPKVGGKDILQAFNSSNGFNSGYNSDPYASVISSGYPQLVPQTQKQTKTKASRIQGKEKE